MNRSTLNVQQYKTPTINRFLLVIDRRDDDETKQDQHESSHNSSLSLKWGGWMVVHRNDAKLKSLTLSPPSRSVLVVKASLRTITMVYIKIRIMASFISHLRVLFPHTIRSDRKFSNNFLLFSYPSPTALLIQSNLFTTIRHICTRRSVGRCCWCHMGREMEKCSRRTCTT